MTYLNLGLLPESPEQAALLETGLLGAPYGGKAMVCRCLRGRVELPHSPALMGEGLFGFSPPFVKGGLRGVSCYAFGPWEGVGVHTDTFPRAKSRVRKNTGSWFRG